jgi:predicted metal-dependent HD superfamily phosphohydrolase
MSDDERVDDERVVRDAWRRITGVRGGVDATIGDVIRRHREPHRRYHSLTHVASVLRAAQELIDADAAAPDVDDRERDADATLDVDAILVAAIFHDAVYDTRSADNEARSAHLAADAVAMLGWEPERCDLVSRLVLATATHEPADRIEAVLLDADLSILGADPATYVRYVAGVRAEYDHVDDQAWCSGRGEVLRRFLDRPHIYATDVMRARAEARARANLTDELAAL